MYLVSGAGVEHMLKNTERQQSIDRVQARAEAERRQGTRAQAKHMHSEHSQCTCRSQAGYTQSTYRTPAVR